ncbi:hypothetical protein BDN70DRAFT_870209 [Pholiota conissans]|uniref:Uncharacterized protein n=1 Tax=Pholiota conissans TaxID=109636 RepID=A0A9P5ZGA6_9AGAR|nr:hypothetical protein BDN70DRAFT_870209 [Pholiota conissans]
MPRSRPQARVAVLVYNFDIENQMKSTYWNACVDAHTGEVVDAESRVIKGCFQIQVRFLFCRSVILTSKHTDCLHLVFFLDEATTSKLAKMDSVL